MNDKVLRVLEFTKIKNELKSMLKNNREKLNYAYTLMEKVKNGIEKNGVTINASESV